MASWTRPFGLIALLVAAGCGGGLSPDPVEWEASLPMGMLRGTETDRNLVVFFQASWCGVCREMKSTVFRDPEIVAALSGFVPVLLDVDTYPHIAREYAVNAIPAVLVMSENGEVLERTQGLLTTQQMRALLAAHTDPPAPSTASGARD